MQVRVDARHRSTDRREMNEYLILMNKIILAVTLRNKTVAYAFNHTGKENLIYSYME